MNRRTLMIGAAAISAAARGMAQDAAGVGPSTLRRVVVTPSRDDSGTSVLADGEPTNAIELNGTRIMRLWETESVPAELPATEDAGIAAGSAYRKGFAGTGFYVAEIPPGIGRDQIPLHSNDTIDYMAILTGEIHLVLPDRELLLRQGDTLVQCGVTHTWENRSDGTCRLLFVVVPATRADSPGRDS